MSTELVTQIVILLTALVGLYKAATYRPPGIVDSDVKTGSKREAPAIFDALLSYAGIFGFMLIMPAFVWAFTAITSHMNSSSSKKKDPSPQYSITYKVPENPSTLDLELVAASQIPYENNRGDALQKLSDRSLAACQIKLAITAALAIPYENSREDALSKVINVIHNGQCEKPNKSKETDQKPATAF